MASGDKRRLGWQDILAPHVVQTEARMQQQPVVLYLKDTTELAVTGQEISGLGLLSFEAPPGMYLHLTYVATPTQETLGVADAWMWAAWHPNCADRKRPRVRQSLRWTDGNEWIAETARTMPEIRLTCVAAREADTLELMQHAHAVGHPADWLIRSQHNRHLPDGGQLLVQVLADSALGETKYTMPSRHGHRACTLRQQVFACQISLPDDEGGQKRLTSCIAREAAAPEGIKQVEWRPLSSRKAEIFEAVVELIDRYHCQLRIETFLNRLKNGVVASKPCSSATSARLNSLWVAIWWSRGDWPVWCA